jgi:hypothetical protein
MNGVDHWVICGFDNILIQDKWKESVTQHEVTQFLHCVERIKKRCDSDAKFFLIWACKHLPSTYALTTLREAGVSILNCPISIQALARLVVLDVCEWLGIDPTESLKSIVVQKRIREGSASENKSEDPSVPIASAPAPSAPIHVHLSPKLIRQPVVQYDETDAGKDAKQTL